MSAPAVVVRPVAAGDARGVAQGLGATGLGATGLGAHVLARDWPHAGWVAVPLLAAGLPLLAWAVAGRHPVEGGGAVVFVGVGGFAAWLWLARRRDVVVSRDGRGVRVLGHEGAGPLARPVDLTLPADTVVEIAPFPAPDGAPDVPDRGGDLRLAGGGARLHLARRSGPGWRSELDAAAAGLQAALAPGPPGARSI